MQIYSDQLAAYCSPTFPQRFPCSKPKFFTRKLDSNQYYSSCLNSSKTNHVAWLEKNCIAISSLQAICLGNRCLEKKTCIHLTQTIVYVTHKSSKWNSEQKSSNANESQLESTGIASIPCSMMISITEDSGVRFSIVVTRQKRIEGLENFKQEK